MRHVIQIISHLCSVTVKDNMQMICVRTHVCMETDEMYAYELHQMRCEQCPDPDVKDRCTMQCVGKPD